MQMQSKFSTKFHFLGEVKKYDPDKEFMDLAQVYEDIEEQFGEKVLEGIQNKQLRIKYLDAYGDSCSIDTEVLCLLTLHNTLILLQRDFRSMKGTAYEWDNVSILNLYIVGWGEKVSSSQPTMMPLAPNGAQITEINTKTELPFLNMQVNCIYIFVS